MTQHTNPPVLIVAGPTAGGKSALALDIAERFNGVVINADSMQVYADLRIITARPSLVDEARVPHRLYGVLPAAEACSVGRWLDLVLAEIKTAWAQEKLPVVTGGTGLYLKCLMEGLSPIPEVPDAIRAAARQRMADMGADAFHAALAAVDPEAAALPPRDTQRTTRAWEVFQATGMTLSRWQAAHPPTPPLGARFLPLVLMPPREDLYANCNQRFDVMLERGALAEVAALDAQGLDARLPAMKALGVPELRAHLHGEMDLAAARDRATQLTRNFAKRQCTWFRNQLGTAEWVRAQYSESVRDKIFSFIRQFWLTP
ncbi:MAG: tRNA (adenosine(37)-N6)-dimethylallyltransferase MiaA [Magnetospiraceae bacterium]